MTNVRETIHFALPTTAVEAALHALLDDPDFLASARNKRFLQYIVDEQLAGRGERIKAYSIATEIFGRPTGFDPAQDPIVRIEATRLRAALAHYYSHFSSRASIRIDMPKGGYIPTFEALSEPPMSPETASMRSLPDTAALSEPAGRWMSPLLRRTLPFVLLAVCAAVVTGAVLFRAYWLGPGDLVQKPVLLVELDPGGARFTPTFRDELLGSLARFERWQVQDISPDATLKVASTSRQPRNAYRLSIREDGQDIWWKLTDQTSGEMIGSEVVRNVDANAQTATNFISLLADRLGSSGGLVLSAEMQREAGRNTLGYGCIARMEAEIAIWDRRDRLPAIKQCLESTLRKLPDDSQYLTALARVTMRMAPLDNPDPAIVRKADNLIAQAIALRPDSAQSYLALAILRTRQGDFPGALQATERAAELNPADHVVQAYSGVALFANGRVDEGVSKMKAAEATQVQLPPEIGLYLALAAYAGADYDEAIRRANIVTSVSSLMPSTVRAASFAQRGETEQAQQELDGILTFAPDIRQTFSRRMRTRGIAPDVSDKLRAGLAKAGLVVE